MKPEDIEDLKQLIEFLKENQVAEFDLDRGDMKIRLKFSQAVQPMARRDRTYARQSSHCGRSGQCRLRHLRRLRRRSACRRNPKANCTP